MAYSIRNVEHVDVCYDLGKTITAPSARAEGILGSSSCDLVRKDESHLDRSNFSCVEFGRRTLESADDTSSVCSSPVFTSDARSSAQTVPVVPVNDILRFMKGLDDLKFSHEDIKEMVFKFFGVNFYPPSSDGQSESTRSSRSIKRMQYRDKCRSLHERPGYCYLAPIAWKERNAIAKLLGEYPTIEAVLNTYSDNVSFLRNLSSFYVVLVSAETASYHFSTNAHQSLGTLLGLINGLKKKWAARGSSLEKFSPLSHTDGHVEFTIPLRSRIGSRVPLSNHASGRWFLPSDAVLPPLLRRIEHCDDLTKRLIRRYCVDQTIKGSYVELPLAYFASADISGWNAFPEIFHLLSRLKRYFYAFDRMTNGVLPSDSSTLPVPLPARVAVSLDLIQALCHLLYPESSDFQSSVDIKTLVSHVNMLQCLLIACTQAEQTPNTVLGHWVVSYAGDPPFDVQLTNFVETQVPYLPGYSYLLLYYKSFWAQYISEFGAFPKFSELPVQIPATPFEDLRLATTAFGYFIIRQSIQGSVQVADIDDVLELVPYGARSDTFD